jgi:tetratricopeptide (TPR) repeat protein
MVFDIRDGFEDVRGVPVIVIHRVLDTVRETIDGLAATEPEDEDLQRLRLVMRGDFAEIYLRAGDRKAATASAQQALALARELAKANGNGQAWRNLALALWTVGDAKMQAGDRAGALAAYEEGLKIARELAKDKGNAQAQTDLVVSLTKVAQVSPDPGPLYREALAILEALEKEGRLSKVQQGWIGWVKGKLAALPAASR